MNYLREKKIQAAAYKNIEKAIIEMSEQIPSLICINMINTNIFISPGASGLAEVHLQCVAYGNQVTASKGDVQSVLGDVVRAVRDLMDHGVEVRRADRGLLEDLWLLEEIETLGTHAGGPPSLGTTQGSGCCLWS